MVRQKVRARVRAPQLLDGTRLIARPWHRDGLGASWRVWEVMYRGRVIGTIEGRELIGGLSYSAHVTIPVTRRRSRTESVGRFKSLRPAVRALKVRAAGVGR